MFRKVSCLIGVFLFCTIFLSPALRAQYRAEDIICPPGYKVIKVAESNRITEPYRLTFDSSGNLVAGTYGFMFFKVDPDGGVEILGKTRKQLIGPQEVEPATDGTYLIRSWLWPPGLHEVYKFTPPDSYDKVIGAYAIGAIGYDRIGNFYAALRQESTSPWMIVRYDADYSPIEITTLTTSVRDFVFDADNNLFMLMPSASLGYTIREISAGENGIPGPEDPLTIFAWGLTAANNMAIDDAGNFYTDAYIRTETNGFSAYDIFQLEKTHPSGYVEKGFGPELPRPGGLACRGGFIYVSEWARNVVSKIDLTTLEKTDFTEDFGLAGAGPIAFDVNDDLYTHVFREYRLLRMNLDGSFSQVGAGTGYAQSIATDGTYFYLGSSDTVGSNGNQILRVDPLSGTTDVLAMHLGGWRGVTFDSFGRLVLCAIINETANLYRADIINLQDGTATPYVTGLHNKGRGMAFDARQNIYLVEGIGDGVKKVALDKDYSPARDLSGEPLFYDLRSNDPVPPTIYFIAVNDEEEVFIPRMDTGDVLIGDKAGNVDVLAQGLTMPTNVTIDKYGALFVSDMGNGIFKIIHERWTIPAVIKLKEAIIEEIRASAIPQGTKTSLIKILASVDESLLRGNRVAAIEVFAAFQKAVAAQAGRKIPVDLARRWTDRSSALIRSLRELD